MSRRHSLTLLDTLTLPAGAIGCVGVVMALVLVIAPSFGHNNGTV